MQQDIGENVEIGEGTQLGNNIIIKGNIKIGENNSFGNNVLILGNCEIGNKNYFSDFCSIGRLPQHMRYKYELNNDYKSDDKKIIIGSNNIFREFITIHMPLENLTSIGSNCYIMDYNHISHDTKIFDNVNLANNCQIGGYSTILNDTNVGLSTVIHQYSTIGSYCMIGMGSVVIRDISPFLVVAGSPAKKNAINEAGMKNKGFSDDEIEKVKEYYLERNEISNSNIEFIQNEINKFKKYSKRKLISLISK